MPRNADSFADQLQNLIRKFDADKARHDEIVALVDWMLELNKKNHSRKLASSEFDSLDREFAATEAQIDTLVYELYGISADQRKIVEGEEA